MCYTTLAFHVPPPRSASVISHIWSVFFTLWCDITLERYDITLGCFHTSNCDVYTHDCKYYAARGRYNSEARTTSILGSGIESQFGRLV